MSYLNSVNSNLVATDRDYNTGMSFPNLETSLTTLAFMSFGAFLLSMILQALNVTGRRRRDTNFCIGKNCEENIYDLSEAVRLALNALNFAVFDRELPDCEARALCNTFSKTRRMGGIYTLAPFITGLSLNFLHERKPHIFTLDKWDSLKKIISNDECETHFNNCRDKDDEIFKRKDDDGYKKRLMMDNKWQLKRKKTRIYPKD